MHTQEIRTQKMSLGKGSEPIEWCLISESTSEEPRLSSPDQKWISMGSLFAKTPVDFHLEPCVPLKRCSFCWSDSPKTSINTIYASNAIIRQTNNQPIRKAVSQTSDSGRLPLIESPTSYGMIKRIIMIYNLCRHLQDNTSVCACVCVLICMHAYPMSCDLLQSLTLAAPCKAITRSCLSVPEH